MIRRHALVAAFAAMIAGAAVMLCVPALRGAPAGEIPPSALACAEEKCSPSLRERLASARPADTVAVWIFLADRGAGARRDRQPCLSTRAARRRALRASAAAGARDLPIHSPYVDSIRTVAARIRHASRYFNAVSVEMEAGRIAEACRYRFVRSIDLIASGRRPSDPPRSGARRSPLAPPARGECSVDFGDSYDQLNQVGLVDLIERGYNGSGSVSGGEPVLIGVLDTGFRLNHPAFSLIEVEAQYDFINNDSVTSDEAGDPAGQSDHGTTVLGVLAGYAEGDLIGPAWGARYLLAKTEIVGSETVIEEDHWVAGIEWADSAGADVVTSSLGYILWYTSDQLDGNTALCTRAADIAVSHGVIVVNSAGNQGVSGLVAPADGDSVFAVGAVDRAGEIASFSSRGPSADGRTKPDFTAMGVGVRSISGAAGYGDSNYGTSFAAPIVAGVCALLLEQHPDWDPIDMRDTLRATASRSAAPDNEYGWGIPRATLAEPPVRFGLSAAAFPNPFNAGLNIYVTLDFPRVVTVKVYDIRGSHIKTIARGKSVQRSLSLVWDGSNERGDRVASGIYLLAVSSRDFLKTIKIVLIR